MGKSRNIAAALIVIAAVGANAARAASILDDSYPGNAPINFDRMHKVVSSDFLDPGSAQYKKISMHEQPGRGVVFCGWVNSKNSFGGYTKFYPFWMSVKDEKAIVNQEFDDDILADLSNMTFEMYGCKNRLGL